MKVRELLEQLKSYKPEDELLVAYWDREFVETSFDSDDNVKITNDLWSQAIRRAEKAEFWQVCGSEEICDQVRQLLDEQEGESDDVETVSWSSSNPTGEIAK